jgi:hypothetical protein
MGVSLALHACRKRHAGLLIGQWAAPILILGLYNKIVKLHGDEREEDEPDFLKDDIAANEVS